MFLLKITFILFYKHRNQEKVELTVGKHFRNQQKNQVKKSKYSSHPNTKQNPDETFRKVYAISYKKIILK